MRIAECLIESKKAIPILPLVIQANHIIFIPVSGLFKYMQLHLGSRFFLGLCLLFLVPTYFINNKNRHRYHDDKHCFKNNSIRKLFFEAPTPENTIDSSKATALILTHTLSCSSKSNEIGRAHV